MDAPAAVLVIELEATGRQRPTCRLRAGPAAALEIVPARETSLIAQAPDQARVVVPARETSPIGQALGLVRVIVPDRARRG